MQQFLRPTSLTVLLVLFGCGGPENRSATSAGARDSAGVVIVTADLTADDTTCSIAAQPDWRVGDDDTDDETLDTIRGIGAFRDGGFAIANGRAEVRIYNRNGLLAGSYESRGEGPSEFRNAFYAFVTTSDTVFVGDHDPWRFLVFDRNANWIRTVTADPPVPNSPRDLAVLDDGRLVLGNEDLQMPTPEFRPSVLDVVVYSRSGALADSVGRFTYGRRGALEGSDIMMPGMFDARTSLTARGSNVALGSGSEPEIRTFDIAGDTPKLIRVIRWDAGDRTVSAADVRAAHDDIRASYAHLSEELQTQIIGPLTHPDRPVADRFPVFDDLIYGHDGTLWVKSYLRPGSTGDARWLAFDQSGSYACSLAMPAFDEVAAFGSDFVLVVDALEDGREIIARYGLTR